jgi:hypothetical protein
MRSVRQAIEGRNVFTVEPTSSWQQNFKDMVDQAEGSFELMCMSDKNSSQEDLNKVSKNFTAMKRIMQRFYYFVATGRMSEADARASIVRAMGMFDAGQDMTTFSVTAGGGAGSGGGASSSSSGGGAGSGGASSSSSGTAASGGFSVYYGSPSKQHHVAPASPPCISRSSSLRFNTTPGAAAPAVAGPAVAGPAVAAPPRPQQMASSLFDYRDDSEDFVIRTVSSAEASAAAAAAASQASEQVAKDLQDANTKLAAAYDICTSAIQFREAAYRDTEILARKVRYSMRDCAKNVSDPSSIGEVYSTMEAWRDSIKKLETAGHVYEFAAKQHMNLIIKRDALDMKRAIVQSAPLLRASQAADAGDMSSLD